MNNGISLVIPCLNEELCIGEAVRAGLRAIQSVGCEGEVLVVDNGSRDRSRELAREAGARVIEHSNRGYGEALRAGFAASRFEYVVFLDADLSYPFEELGRLIAGLESGADFVLGNRMNARMEKGAMPFLNRYLGTPVLSWTIRHLHGTRTYDCNSGFRAFRRRDLERLQLRSSGMELASEMLVRVGNLKMDYREVSISFRRDQRDRPPHLRRWRDGFRHLRLITASKFART